MRKIKTETVQKIYLLREEHTLEKERQTIRGEKWLLTWSLRGLAGVQDEPAIDVTFAFKIVNLLLEGQ